MGLSHSRRRSSRAQTDKSHPGQARGSARKKALKEQKRFVAIRRRLTEANYAQVSQDKVQCHIVVNGMAHWSDIFKGVTATMHESIGTKYFGAAVMPALDAIRLDADLNKASFEREVLNELLSQGYALESLEVEFCEGARRNWGRCIWYKDHPSYHQGNESDKKLSPWARSLLNAVFKTEYAGDQQFTLLSTQMAAMALLKQRPRVLLHKSLIFRKAVFSLPKLVKPSLSAVSFTSTVALADAGPFPTFSEALKDFMTRIKEGLDRRRFGMQVLETACWIQCKGVVEAAVPIGFYDARDLGFYTDLLVQDGNDFAFGVNGKEPETHILEQVCAHTLRNGNAFDFMDTLKFKAA